MSNSLRLVSKNYLWESATTQTYSSQDANFPAANLQKYSRGFPYRSNPSAGYFLIDSTNNKINFKVSGGGAEKTATLTSAEYTATTLATEIKTRMDAASGGDTYTITWSATTGKWTILSSGAYLSVLWLTGTNHSATSASTLGFSAAADSTGATTYTGSLVAIHTQEHVRFDLSAATDIDTVVVLFDPIDGYQLTAGAVVKLQANASDAWTSPSVNQTITLDTTYKSIIYYFGSTQTYRYWRLVIVDPTNPDFYVEIGKVILGKYVSLTRSPSQGFEWSIDDKSKSQMTEYGHKYVDQFTKLRSIALDMKGLPYADVQTLEEIYLRLGNRTPLFAHMKHSVYSSNHFAIYGYLEGDFNPKHLTTSTSYAFFNQGLSIKETY